MSQDGVTSWRPWYHVQMFTLDGLQCLVDKQSFKFFNLILNLIHNEKELKNLKLGGNSRTCPKG